MNAKLYVGNLPFNVENIDLENLFSQSGTVQSVNIIKDRDTGRAKGFGFVEMKNQEEASTAVLNLNEKDFRGRPLRVNPAHDNNQGHQSKNRY